jgi:DNA-binding GntR family transcriptional regulator
MAPLPRFFNFAQIVTAAGLSMLTKGMRSTKVRGRRPAATSRRAAASLRDSAYNEIKHRIITCAFRPGEYINELQLSALLHIGRTPVHQALDRLMVEGMVEVIPRKGVIVKPVSLNEVLQIIEVRLINEPLAARLAAEHASDADLSDMADVLKRAKHWASVRNVENLMLLDREFHLLVAKAARNDVLTDLLRNLHERSLRFWFISLNAPTQYQLVQVEHAAILEAIGHREPNKADMAMRRHIESFRRNVSQFM